MKQFFSMALMPEPSGSSLVALMCYESHEIDGPLDEPFCEIARCPGGASCSDLGKQGLLHEPSRLMQDPHRAAMLQSDWVNAGVMTMETLNHNGPAKLGVPERKRKSRGYPAAKELSTPDRLRKPDGDAEEWTPATPGDLEFSFAADTSGFADVSFGFDARRALADFNF